MDILQQWRIGLILPGDHIHPRCLRQTQFRIRITILFPVPEHTRQTTANPRNPQQRLLRSRKNRFRSAKGLDQLLHFPRADTGQQI